MLHSTFNNVLPTPKISMQLRIHDVIDLSSTVQNVIAKNYLGIFKSSYSSRVSVMPDLIKETIN